MTAPVLEDRRPSRGRLAGFALLLVAVSWGLGAFAAWPWTASAPGVALLRISLKHVAPVAVAARALSAEDLARLPRHMRPQSTEGARTTARRDTRLVVRVDGRSVLDAAYRPAGLRHDGPTFVYEEVSLPPGRHVLDIALTDVEPGTEPALDRQLRRDVDVRPGQVLLVELSPERQLTVR